MLDTFRERFADEILRATAGAPGSSTTHTHTHSLFLLHFHSLHYTANSWRPRGRSWVFVSVCVCVCVHMCVCVCVWVLREAFGPNWHRHVKCSREPSWHPPIRQNSPLPDENGGRRMNANKSADPWVTFSIPALRAMRTETGGLGGIQQINKIICLFKWTSRKWLLGGRGHRKPR